MTNNKVAGEIGAFEPVKGDEIKTENVELK